MKDIEYKEIIEKQASAKTKAINLIKNNKKKLLATGLGAGALGTAYLASDDKTKSKINNGAKTVGKSVLTAEANGAGQDIIKNLGGLAGIALAKKKGLPLSKAISSGGLAGMALGDIAGATVIPAVELRKRHEKEFGTAPDLKSTATVMAANVLPTAALWGGLYGLKSGIKKRKQISSNLNAGLNSLGKNTAKLKDDFVRYKGNVERINSIGGVEGVKKLVGGDVKSIGNDVKSLAKSFAPLGVASFAAGVPTYFATPDNVVNLKKKRLEEQNMK